MSTIGSIVSLLRRPMTSLVVGALAVAPVVATAQTPVELEKPPTVKDGNDQSLEPLPDLPELPPKVKSGETLEPDVTIIQRERETIEQYSVSGRVYAIKVSPKGGKPYYLIDIDGDGHLESRRSDLDPKLLIPAWVIFSWK